MQPVKRLLLPIILLMLASLACSSGETSGLGGAASADPGRMGSVLTAGAPIATSPVDGFSAPISTEIPFYTPTALPNAIVEAGSLNMRDGPDTSFQVLMTIPNGEELTVQGQYRACDWLKVERITGDVGWVKGGPGFANFTGNCSAIQHGSFRPLNGVIVFDRRAHLGPGSLTVDNSTPTDGLVVLVDQAGTPVVGFYLRNMEAYVLTGCPDGVYYIYYQNGQGWDGDANRFKIVELIKRMDQPIEYVTTAEGYTTWTLTLANSGAGTATASDISPNAFPELY